MSNIARTLNCKNCGNMVWAFINREFEYWKIRPLKDLEAFEKERMDEHNKTCLNKDLLSVKK